MAGKGGHIGLQTNKQINKQSLRIQSRCIEKSWKDFRKKTDSLIFKFYLIILSAGWTIGWTGCGESENTETS